MKRHAVYAGSFDPITRGHLSVITRAQVLFSKVTVLVAKHPHKTPLFSLEERCELIRGALREAGLSPEKTRSRIAVASTEGYVVHFAQSAGAGFLLRGIRSSTDAQDELRLAELNRGLAPTIETWFLPTDPNLADVSSSALKTRLRRGEDITAHCTSNVAEALRRRRSPEPQHAL